MKHKFSTIGLIIGAIALMLGLLHFSLGPFSTYPPSQDFEPEQTFSLGSLSIGIGAAEEVESTGNTTNVDRVIEVIVILFGGVAVILGVFGYAQKDPIRIAGGAAFLGATAIALQLFIFAIGVIFVAIVLAVIISNLGIG